MEIHEEHFVANLKNMSGRVIAFRGTPKGIPATDALVRICLSAANALLALDTKVGSIDRQRLGILEQRSAVAVEFAAVQIRLAAARAAVVSAQSKHDGEMHALFSPEPIADVAPILLDLERRGAFLSADQGERVDLWKQMARGEQGALLAALARFEFGAVSERARNVYEALARSAHPHRVKAFEIENERLSWGRQAVDLITAAMDEVANLTGPASLIEEPQAA